MPVKTDPPDSVQEDKDEKRRQRLHELATQFQRQFWDYIIMALSDEELQKRMADWLDLLRCKDGRSRPNQEVMEEFGKLLRSKENLTVSMESFEAMLKNLRLRWNDYQEWIAIVDDVVGSRWPRLLDQKALFFATSREIITELAPLIRGQATRFEPVARSLNMEKDELVSLASIGVFKSLLYWESKRGALAQYSKIYIVNEVCEALRLQPTITMSEKLGEFLREVDRVKNTLKVELGREPTEEEIADRMHVSVKKIQESADLAPKVGSLDEPIAMDEEGETATLMDVTPGESRPVGDDLDGREAMEELKHEIEESLLRTKGLLGLRLEAFLLQDAEGPSMKFSQAIEVLRKVGYDNFKKKFSS